MLSPQDIWIISDDGHGATTAGKRTPKFTDGTWMPENAFNSTVIKKFVNKLKKRGFNVIETAPTDVDIPLPQRVKIANDVFDRVVASFEKQGKSRIEAIKLASERVIYISVHANALTEVRFGTHGGIETYVYKLDGGFTEKLGRTIHKNIIKGTKLRDRGLKTSGFYVLLKTKMPSVLVECGFMDNLEEAKLLLSDNYREECASELYDAVCELFNIPNVEINPKDIPSDFAKVSWEKAKIKGILDGTNPKDSLTREQLAVVLDRLGLL